MGTRREGDRDQLGFDYHASRYQSLNSLGPPPVPSVLVVVDLVVRLHSEPTWDGPEQQKSKEGDECQYDAFKEGVQSVARRSPSQ